MEKVTVLDAASGEEIGEVPESLGTDEMVLCDNILVMLVREKLSVASPPKDDPAKKNARRKNPHEWTIGAPGPGVLTAIDVTTGRVLWKTDPQSINREKGPGFSRAAPPLWSTQIPLRAQAMVLAEDRLFMAGPPDTMPEDDPYASFEGRLGAQLWAVSAADGKKLAEYPLDALPVFDGLIAADGNLYLSSQDGKLTCFAAVQ